MTENMAQELCNIVETFDPKFKHGLEELPYIDAQTGKALISQALRHASTELIGEVNYLAFMDMLSNFSFVFYGQYLYQNDLEFPQRSIPRSAALNKEWVERSTVNDAIQIAVWRIDEWTPIERPIIKEVQETVNVPYIPDHEHSQYIDERIDARINSGREYAILFVLFTLSLIVGFVLGKLF